MEGLRFVFKPILLLIYLTLLTHTLLATCPEYTTMVVDKKFNIQCESCTENCSVCYVNNEDKVTCAFCSDGYYIDRDKKCKPCFENCSWCDGPALNQCHSTKVGYFMNRKANKIEPCDKQCSHCNPKDKCTDCAEGYFSYDSDTGSSSSSHIDCYPCNIKHCTFCERVDDQINNTEYLSCKFCEQGYALINSRCEKCSDNCQFCQDNSLECIYCEPGYYLNEVTKLCEKVTVPNCFSVNNRNECINCESYFHLVDGKCMACKIEQEHCGYCNKGYGDFHCLSCEHGFYLSDNGRCIKCPDNCSFCNEAGCLNCNSQYFLDDKTKSCVKCEVNNCDECSEPDVCRKCDGGYYLDVSTKKCERLVNEMC